MENFAENLDLGQTCPTPPGMALIGEKAPPGIPGSVYIAQFQNYWFLTMPADLAIRVFINSPVSQYERPRAVALASSARVDKTTKIITEFVTRKDPFLRLKRVN